MKRVISVSSSVLLGYLASVSVYAADNLKNNEVIIGKQLDQKNVQQYWTAERLKNAKELPMPVVNLNNLQNIEPLVNGATGESGNGGLPEKIKIPAQNLFMMTTNNDDDGVGSEIPPNDQEKPIPNDSGTYNQPYTSTRLVPLAADTAYPYRTVGKLFFTIPGQGNFVCSASVLRPRVVVTAGHCTHGGSNGANGFYTNFYFVPAFRDGVAPFQGWYPNYVQTTSTWASGGGTVPNAADYAMFQIADKVINSTPTKIASITGYLGYQTQALSFNHATILGYPCNLDNCQKMHQVNSRNGSSVSPNNVEYGSDMRGGSSGGPWIQNFGEYATGQVEANQPGANRIIGITSYGYDSTSPKVQGSSIPDSRFISLLNSICGRQAGNC